MDTKKEEVQKLVDEILILDSSLQKEILRKAETFFDEQQFRTLKTLLQQMISWQQKTLAKKLEEDPTFRDKLMMRKRELDQQIIAMHREELQEADRAEIEQLMLKIQSL